MNDFPKKLLKIANLLDRYGLYSESDDLVRISQKAASGELALNAQKTDERKAQQLIILNNILNILNKIRTTRGTVLDAPAVRGNIDNAIDAFNVQINNFSASLNNVPASTPAPTPTPAPETPASDPTAPAEVPVTNNINPAMHTMSVAQTSKKFIRTAMKYNPYNMEGTAKTINSWIQEINKQRNQLEWNTDSNIFANINKSFDAVVKQLNYISTSLNSYAIKSKRGQSYLTDAYLDTPVAKAATPAATNNTATPATQTAPQNKMLYNSPEQMKQNEQQGRLYAKYEQQLEGVTDPRARQNIINQAKAQQGEMFADVLSQHVS